MDHENTPGVSDVLDAYRRYVAGGGTDPAVVVTTPALAAEMRGLGVKVVVDAACPPGTFFIAARGDLG